MSYPMGPGGPPGYGAPPPGGGYPPPGGGFGPPPGGGFGPPPGPGGPGMPGGFGPPPPFGGGDTMLAESKVKPPAITMMICTIIGMLLQVVSFFMNVLGTGIGVANSGNNGNDAFAQLMGGAIGMVGNVVGLLAGGVCIYGFLKMMKLQSRGLAYTAVIMSMIPCTGSCCYLNLFIGIWALITLSDDNVKASFT